MRTLFKGRRQTYVDGRPCCVGSDCHLVLHLGCELVMEIMLICVMSRDERILAVLVVTKTHFPSTVLV